MQERIIQCKNFYPVRKHVYQWKNRGIQHEKVLNPMQGVESNARNLSYSVFMAKNGNHINWWYIYRHTAESNIRVWKAGGLWRHNFAIYG